MSISGALASRSAASASANELAVMAARILLAPSSRFATDDSDRRPTLLWRWSSRDNSAVRTERSVEPFRAKIDASQLLRSSQSEDRLGIPPELEARCSIESGATTALIRFEAADVPDQSLDGASVEWFDQRVTIDRGCARIELDQLRRLLGEHGFAKRVLQGWCEFQVNGRQWTLDGLEVSEVPNRSPDFK